MKRKQFPRGWNEARVQRVIKHYESQTEEQAVAEDGARAEEEAAFRKRGETVMVVPTRLVPDITKLIAKQQAARKTGS